MAYSKEEVLSRMKGAGVVPLFSHNDVEVSRNILEACYNGGLTVFEYTNRQPNSFEIFSELMRYTEKLPGFMLGIGTIMDAEAAKKFIDAGAHFIIAPILDDETGEVCTSNNIPWIPGCHTLSEIVKGMKHGATIIKVFPGSVLGTKFISSIRPVVPNVPLMITGGVEPTEASFKSWFDAGATCVGLGSNLFSKDIMERKDYRALETRVKSILEVAQHVRVR
jgi:2-dehydro-3-deoxyphosphogluconate aldolase / (4S)-4-hydroxy-2-oxoglutarate aldolase